jgi:transcriptional regulator with XRE-family HTH domain
MPILSLMAALAWWSVSDEQRRAFGAALQEAMALRGVSQGELAEHMKTRQSVISSWCYGKFAASPVAIFELEDYLELPPEWLSHHFKFGRVGQLDENITTERSILKDSRLTDDDHKLLLAILDKQVTYNELTAARAAPRARSKSGDTAKKATALAKKAAVAKGAAPVKKSVAKKAAPARKLSRAVGDGR